MVQVDLEDGQISVDINTDNLCGGLLAVNKGNANVIHAPDDMGIGQDVT